MKRVETELRRTASEALFVVKIDEPAFASALSVLAFEVANGEFTRRFPRETPDVERIFARFERHMLELLEQTAGLCQVPWADALGETASRLDAAGAEWFLAGSAALAVRGIDIHPRDIDIVASEHRLVSDALADTLIEPPSYDSGHGWIAAWFGRAFLGARVEWVADVYDDVDDRAGPCEFGPAVAARLDHCRWNGRDLRLPPLDAQLAVNERRGLVDRVRAIRSFANETAVELGPGLR